MKNKKSNLVYLSLIYGGILMQILLLALLIMLFKMIYCIYLLSNKMSNA